MVERKKNLYLNFYIFRSIIYVYKILISISLTLAGEKPTSLPKQLAVAAVARATSPTAINSSFI